MLSSINSEAGSNKETWPYLIHDMVIRADVCNLRCKYCGLGIEHVPPLRIIDGQIGLKEKDGRWIDVESIDDIAYIAKHVALKIQKSHHCPQLKVSGGELSIVDRWMDLFFDLAEHVEIIQLLTNGTGINLKHTERIAGYENIVVQISLDGISHEENRFRGLSESAVGRILQLIDRLVDAGIDVEVNAVLHEASLSTFSKFIHWAVETSQGKAGDLVLLPRPVRGQIAEQIRGNVAQIGAFVQQLEKAPNSVLPPASYLQRLCELLETGRRKWPCYVPYFVLGTDERGEIPVCTCGSHLGAAGSAIASNRVLLAGSFFRPEQAIDSCKDCMTQYEMLNLLYEKELSVAACSALPFFKKSEKRFDQLISALKKRLQYGGTVALSHN